MREMSADMLLEGCHGRRFRRVIVSLDAVGVAKPVQSEQRGVTAGAADRYTGDDHPPAFDTNPEACGQLASVEFPQLGRHPRRGEVTHREDGLRAFHRDQRGRRGARTRISAAAAEGSARVDGMTVETYEGRLTDNLRELCDEVHSGRYNPLPVRRTYIPKADGGKRPLGHSGLDLNSNDARRATCYASHGARRDPA